MVSTFPLTASLFPSGNGFKCLRYPAEDRGRYLHRCRSELIGSIKWEPNDRICSPPPKKKVAVERGGGGGEGGKGGSGFNVEQFDDNLVDLMQEVRKGYEVK